MRPDFKVVPLAAVLLLAGCGPTAAEREKQTQERLKLEEKARQETVTGNKAITDMTRRAFRQKTLEELAKEKADKDQRVQALIEEQKRAEAAAQPKP